MLLKNNFALLALTSAMLVGCGGGSSSGGGSGDDGEDGREGDVIPTRSDYGIYSTMGGDDDYSDIVGFMLTKNGSIAITYTDGSGTHNLPVQGFATLKDAKSAINREFTLLTGLEMDQPVKAHLKMDLGQSNGDIMPFTFSIPDLDVSIDSMMVYVKPTAYEPNFDLLSREYKTDDNTHYKYLGKNTIEFTDDYGCRTKAEVRDSGLSADSEAQSNVLHFFDLKIEESTCPTNSDTTGFVYVIDTPVFSTLSIDSQFVDQLTLFSGYFVNASIPQP